MTHPLRDLVAEAFAPLGVLARATDHFSPRQGQTDMALAVADVVAHGGSLVVEAGTGVGKTFAYLVPALLSGERVLLSTATKALQDQLFARDLPRLVQALNLPIRLALLKGRSSYLCTHRMEMARRDTQIPDRHTVHLLSRVETWSLSTRTGDLAELPGLDERSPLIPLITSNRENCLGSQCPKFKTCHVNAARRDALGADVVVINHHLFFADMAVRETGMAELLPSVRVVIFDEAHQLNEVGVNFLGHQLGTAQLLDVTRDMLATGLQLARGLADWQGVCAGLERAARELRLMGGKRHSAVKLRWTERAPDEMHAGAWEQSLQDVGSACVHALQALDTVSEIAPDFMRLHDRVAEVAKRVDAFLNPCAPDAVRWVDISASQMRLMEAPLDIAETVRERLMKQSSVMAADEADQEPPPWLDEPLFDQTAAAYDEAGDMAFDAQDHDAEASAFDSAYPMRPVEDTRPRAWVFTSATLGDDPRLRWFTEPCGLESATVLRVSSPFDYPAQASLYVPRDIVRPNDPAHSAQVASLACAAVRRLGGRTLVLTTTLRALRAIGDMMKQQLEGSGIEVLVQGEWPKRHLMERFRDGAKVGESGCVLVASATFWEGFDVPGDALQLVIIDKLPFPPPNDPLVEARSKRLESQGRSPFNDYFVPEAVVALKQGAGRLIRTESDQGVLVLCDNRLVTTGYGRRLIAALPPMHQLQTSDALVQSLDALNQSFISKAATTTF
ncbi:helicase [Limnohabitans sp. Jir61]|uniref:ATP-dependent DNA helicase n=1 Tax=Limnohabitans sp. Jir61 TaxID=1826168 RepID=UPI000D36727A|nr:ATP-dependent DNA helicase [Limnohabitans sp. Jir61]PUE32928.1 helicase [Limnohabitans sp. Jir61]